MERSFVMKALGNLLIRAGKAIGGKIAFPVIEAAVAAGAGVVVGVLAYRLTPAGNVAKTVAEPATVSNSEPAVIPEPDAKAVM